MTKTCLHCAAPFKTRSTKRKYCCHPCYAKAIAGHKRNVDMRGPKNPNWRGGRRIDKDGYVLIHAPYHPYAESDGYVREHRLIMEKHLKRFLTSHEVVHHLNENVQDNRIENLQVLQKSDHDRISIHLRHQNGWKPWEKLRLPENRWAEKYESCIECQETSRRHQGKGLCGRCYQRRAKLTLCLK